MTALEMSALRAAAELPPGRRSGATLRFGDLAADCSARLRARLARPLRTSGDWSIGLPPGGCTCDLCDTLRVFLEDKSRRTFEWPLAPSRAGGTCTLGSTPPNCPLPTRPRRQGRPYTLVLKKTEALFAREQEARIRDETDLEWLAAQWNLRA